VFLKAYADTMDNLKNQPSKNNDKVPGDKYRTKNVDLRKEKKQELIKCMIAWLHKRNVELLIKKYTPCRLRRLSPLVRGTNLNTHV
jgi:DUF2075 family protein